MSNLEEHSDTRPAVWMISAAVCFSTMVALTHALGSRCDWLTIALVRASVMFVSSVAIARLAGAKLVFSRPRTLWMRSFAGSFSLVCSFYASTRLPVGDFITLSNTYPLWIVVLASLVGKQAPTAGDGLRIALALAGVALIGRPSLSGDNFGAAIALLGSVSTAVAMIGLHRLREVDSRAVVAHFSGVATVIAGTWFLLRGPGGGALVGAVSGANPSLLGADPVTWLMLLGVAICGTVGQLFLTRAYASGAPARVSVLGLSQVIFGLGFDVLLWHRAMSPATLAGMVLVVAPTAWLLAHPGVVPSAEEIPLTVVPNPGES